MKSAIRMILLVSGVYWGTYIPAWIIYALIVSFGATWESMDKRCNLYAAILMRLARFLMNHISPCLNPLIYFWIHKDLWAGFKKMLGLKAKFSSEDEAHNTTVSTIEAH